MKYISNNEKDTLNFSENYAKKLKKGSILYLIGDLGSGKTQFVKGLAKNFGVKENVSSPTFVYENIYKGKNGINIYHFDLYRENQLDTDIKQMIIEASKDPKGIVVIEWAERIKEDLGLTPQILKFKWIDKNTRQIEIETKQ